MLIPDCCSIIQGIYIIIPKKNGQQITFELNTAFEGIFVNSVFSVTPIQNSLGEVLLLQRRYVTAHCSFPLLSIQSINFPEELCVITSIVQMIEIVCKLCRQLEDHNDGKESNVIQNAILPKDFFLPFIHFFLFVKTISDSNF